MWSSGPVKHVTVRQDGWEVEIVSDDPASDAVKVLLGWYGGLRGDD